MLLTREGSLFENQHKAYAHGVSNAGVMNRGIALDFKDIYPSMFKEYKRQCANRNLNPGDCFFYQSTNKEPDVFNLITQDNLFSANLDYLKLSVIEMHKIALKKNINDIAMPKIGCGLGNLKLEELLNALDIFTQDSYFHITIYSI